MGNDPEESARRVAARILRDYWPHAITVGAEDPVRDGSGWKVLITAEFSGEVKTTLYFNGEGELTHADPPLPTAPPAASAP